MSLIGQELRHFIEGPVMNVIAVPTEAGRAAIGRGAGTRVSSTGDRVETMVPRALWPDLLGASNPGCRIALTFVRPSDYCTYQLKGRIDAIADADIADGVWARRYVDAMSRTLVTLGIDPVQIPHWISPSGLARVSYSVDETFLQTPGPTAGARLAEGAA